MTSSKHIISSNYFYIFILHNIYLYAHCSDSSVHKMGLLLPWLLWKWAWDMKKGTLENYDDTPPDGSNANQISENGCHHIAFLESHGGTHTRIAQWLLLGVKFSCKKKIKYILLEQWRVYRQCGAFTEQPSSSGTNGLTMQGCRQESVSIALRERQEYICGLWVLLKLIDDNWDCP